MNHKPTVKDARVGDRVLISSDKNVDWIAVQKANIPQLIEELQQYE
jgi:hypothetical protein